MKGPAAPSLVIARRRVEALQIVARNLRQARKAAGLSQRELAALSGRSVDEVTQIERCVRNPSLWSLVDLARALGLATRDLLD